MDLQHGVLLLLTGVIGIVILCTILVKAEKKKAEEEEDKDNPVRRFWRNLGR
jgi:hypothetical protein